MWQTPRPRGSRPPSGRGRKFPTRVRPVVQLGDPPRMPQTLHAELARAAERERVSLNQFITDALSGALGWRAPSACEAAGGTRTVPTQDLEGESTASASSKNLRITNAVFVANGIILVLLGRGDRRIDRCIALASGPATKETEL